MQRDPLLPYQILLKELRSQVSERQKVQAVLSLVDLLPTLMKEEKDFLRGRLRRVLIDEPLESVLNYVTLLLLLLDDMTVLRRAENIFKQMPLPEHLRQEVAVIIAVEKEKQAMTDFSNVPLERLTQKHQYALEILARFLQIDQRNLTREEIARCDEELVELGKVRRILIAHRDRFVCFGYEYFEAFCERHRTEIVVINGESLSPEQELVRDLIAIVTVFSARLHGLRSYKKAIKDAALQKD